MFSFKDLQKFLDDATNGAIYFSFGSNLKEKNLPLHKIRKFIDTFSNLTNIKVLWKYGNMDLPVSSNVLIRKWLPQNEILGN